MTGAVDILNGVNGVGFLGYFGGSRRVPVYITYDRQHDVIDLWSMSDASGHIGYASTLTQADELAERFARARRVRP